jgi:hypothetical protein
MEHTLDKIISKPSDYKLCPLCGNVNWYENEDCYFCGDGDLRITDTMTREEMDDWWKDEYEFWKIEEVYDDEEIFNIKKEI